MSKKIIKKFLNIFAWSLIGLSVVLLIFGFGEDGWRILKVVKFWTVVNSLWLLAVLVFTIEGRIK
jgi:hypothetical protein